MITDLVTVGSYPTPLEAHLARIHLEHEGVPAVVENEHLSTLCWLYTQAVGGAQVRVQSGDEVEALRILRESKTGAVPPAASAEEETDLTVECPRCGSHEISKNRFSRAWAFLPILVSLPPVPIPTRKPWRCLGCRSRW